MKIAISSFVLLVSALFLANVTSNHNDLNNYPKISPDSMHRIQVPIAPTGPNSEVGNPEVRALVEQMNRDHVLKTEAFWSASRSPTEL